MHNTTSVQSVTASIVEQNISPQIQWNHLVWMVKTSQTSKSYLFSENLLEPMFKYTNKMKLWQLHLEYVEEWWGLTLYFDNSWIYSWNCFRTNKKRSMKKIGDETPKFCTVYTNEQGLKSFGYNWNSYPWFSWLLWVSIAISALWQTNAWRLPLSPFQHSLTTKRLIPRCRTRSMAPPNNQNKTG